MSSQSRIEWTELTWNPVTGCTKISPGCKFCYAEKFAKRLQAMGAPGYEDGFAVALHPDRLDHPRRRKRATTWFVNSMSDLFQEKVPFSYVDRVMEVIADTPQHRYQLLTKRAERMAKYCKGRTVPKNAWLGVSVEDKKYGVPRIDVLRGMDVSVRFLSIEPLLEDIGGIDLAGISWVIVGGESGPKARPMRAEWARAIQTQCELSDVAFFFKQWGAHGADGVRRSKKLNGRRLDGKIWDQLPA
jgi:protein gp37